MQTLAERFAAFGLALPPQWSISRVGDLLSPDRGISVGVMYPGSHDPVGIPLIRAGDLAGNRINPAPVYRITNDKHAEYKRTALEGGELLISLVGEIGNCAIVPCAMLNWNVARAIAVLRFKQPVVAKFVRLILMSRPLQNIMHSWATTTVQTTLNLKEIKELPVPLPPEHERERIVEVIEALECKMELNLRMDETLQGIAGAIFKSWFLDFDAVRAKADGRQPAGMSIEMAALFPASFTDSPLGKTPFGWEVRPIGDVTRVVGGSTPRTEEPAYWQDGKIAWATPKDLARLTSPVLSDTERHITEDGLAQISSGLLPRGTVLLSSRAPIGYLAVAELPIAVNQGFIALICERELPNYFVLNWVRANLEEIKAHANGTTFLEISKASFRPLKVVVPPRSILDAFVGLALPLYKRISANLRESMTLIETRDALLPKLISGEIRIKQAAKLMEARG